MAAKQDSTAAALRAFTILEVVAQAERAVSLTDVMAAVGLPKPTVYRILSLLEEAGLLLREPASKRYSVGPRLAQFGLEVMMNGSLRGERHAILQRLVNEVGETCNFTMLDGSEVVYLDRVETAWPLRMNLQTGSRVPLHCSASGKLLLAYLPKAQRQRLLQTLPLQKFTDRTIADRAKLERELDRIRAAGVSTDDEEFIAGLVCVAVPVRLAKSKVAAAVAVHAPTSRMPLERALEHLPSLKRAADALCGTFLDKELPAERKVARAR